MGAVAAAAVATPAMADSGAELAAMRAELAAMKAQLAEVQQQGSASWMDAARQAEVRALVQDVLNDSRNRSAFQEGAGAGHDGKKFYLEGNGFSLGLSGQVQFRYVFNGNDDRDGDAETLSGFEIRRAKLGFAGYIADPKIEYDLVIAHERAGGTAFLEDAILAYKYDNGMKVAIGRMKLPFLAEELLSSKRQLAADRGLSTEFFTLNRSEGINVSGDAIDGQLKWAAMISDGGNGDLTAATADTVDYPALTGRVDYLVFGDFNDVKDLVAFDSDDTLVVGGALHFESPTGSSDPTLAYTVDATYKTGPLSVMGAYMGATDTDDRVLHGVLAQVGYSIDKQLQPFARIDFIDSDQDNVDTLFAVTVGANYYLKGHNAKVTGDVVWVLSDDNPGAIAGLNGGEFSSGLGLSDGGTELNQLAVRGQLQLLF